MSATSRALPGPLPPHVEADTLVGPMLLPRDDQVVTPAILATHAWEPAESAALTALIRRGGHVVDIGAHVGYMTLLASACAGPEGSVLAVEAHAGNFALLHENVARNRLPQARVIHGAAWRNSGEPRTLTVSLENSGDHRVFRREGATDTIEVRSVALDELIGAHGRVDVVKVDTQGTDHVAIEGMLATIARCRPVMLVEFWPPGIEEFGDRPADVLCFYRDLGYEIRMLEVPGLARDASIEALTERARQCPGEYCTLVLQPISPGQFTPR